MVKIDILYDIVLYCAKNNKKYFQKVVESGKLLCYHIIVTKKGEANAIFWSS